MKTSETRKKGKMLLLAVSRHMKLHMMKSTALDSLISFPITLVPRMKMPSHHAVCMHGLGLLSPMFSIYSQFFKH